MPRPLGWRSPWLSLAPKLTARLSSLLRGGPMQARTRLQPIFLCLDNAGRERSVLRYRRCWEQAGGRYEREIRNARQLRDGRHGVSWLIIPKNSVLWDVSCQVEGRRRSIHSLARTVAPTIKWSKSQLVVRQTIERSTADPAAPRLQGGRGSSC